LFTFFQVERENGGRGVFRFEKGRCLLGMRGPPILYKGAGKQGRPY